MEIIRINPSPIYRRELVTLYGQLGKVYDQNPTGIIPVGKVNWDRDIEYLHKVEQQADDYFCYCISTAKKLADETGSIADLRTLIEANRRAARHCRGYRNDKQAAIKHYRECLRVSKLVADSTNDIQDACNIIKYLDEIGRLYELKKERNTAKQYYKEALDYACLLVTRTQSILAKKAASKAWSTWGRMYQIEKNLTEEFACYDKMILLEREIVKEQNTYENCQSLIYSFKWYGKRCSVNNELEKANALLTEALKLANQITEPNDTEERMYELASVYYQCAVLDSCISTSTTKKYLQRAIEIWDNLISSSWSYKELVKSAYEDAKVKLKELDGE